MVTDDHVPVPPPVTPPAPQPPEDAATAAAPRPGDESPAAPAPSSRERIDAAGVRIRAAARRSGAAVRRNAGWTAVTVLAVLAIVTLAGARLTPSADSQTTQSVTAWDAQVATYEATVTTVTGQAGQVDAARVGESGLASGDLLQQGDGGVDLSTITWTCASAQATVALATASTDVAVPSLGPGDPEDYAYEDALDEEARYADAFAAAATYADDVAALDGTLSAACALAERLQSPVQTLGYQDPAVGVGEPAQVGQATTVVCAGPYGCPDGPGASPTWEWGYLSDLHAELAEAFDGACPADLETSCALAVTALDQLAADDGAVLEAWAVANDDDATAGELQALQTALDDRASRFDAAWAEVQAAAPDGSLEGALAAHLAAGFDALASLVAGIQLDDGY